jgi:glycopeptide antibiotics resistance protein
VLLTKITITGRQLSLEALVGLAIGVILTFGIRWLPRGGLVVAGVCSAAAAFVVETLRSDNTTVELHEFNWIPFSSQMGENVSGINSIIDGLWPFVVLAFFAIVQFPACRKKDALLTGLLLAIGVFILEYSQTSITGRFPDITVVLLAVIGWLLPLMYFREFRR